MEEGLEIGASGAVAFFDSDALKPLAAACLLAPAAERWTGALSVITQLVPKSDTTLCTVRQAQCSEVSERATRGNCMPAGPAPSQASGRQRPRSAQPRRLRPGRAVAVAVAVAGRALPCSLLPALADVVVVDYGSRYSRVGRRVAHCCHSCHSCHPSRRPQPRPLPKPLQRQAAYPAWAPVVHCVPSRGCMNRWAPRRSLIVLCWESIRL